MNVLRIVFTVIQLICAVLLVLAVTLQSGKSSGLGGTISGSAETFLSKNKTATLDAKLSRATKWVGGVFLVLTLVLNLLPTA